MKLDSFFQICIAISIFLTVFTLFFNFLVGWQFFGEVDVSTGPVLTGDAGNIFTQVTGFTGGIEYLWLIVTTLAGIGAVTLAIFMHSPAPIAAYLLGEIFFTSYSRAINIVNINSYIPAELLVILTVVILFIYAAAVIGIFGGG